MRQNVSSSLCCRNSTRILSIGSLLLVFTFVYLYSDQNNTQYVSSRPDTVNDRHNEYGARTEPPVHIGKQKVNSRSKNRLPAPLISKEATRELIEQLTKEFQQKLSLPAVKLFEPGTPCKQKGLIGNSCNGTCLQQEIPKDLNTRISQIVEPFQTQITPEYREVLEEMAKEVNGSYEVIIATSASDNHFTEVQELLRNLHLNVFPLLKNFSLVFYDLGLSATNRAQIVKYCKCQVIDFPFNKVPEHFKILNCFGWKTFIINALIKRAEIVVWADSSIRFQKDPKHFNQMLENTKTRGMQLYAVSWQPSFATRTLPKTFHLFGDEACAYINFYEIQAGFGFYSNQNFVRQLVLERWAACALDRRCMCPLPMARRNADRSVKAYSRWRAGKPMEYGLCHRFDQSGLNILVAKLYRERFLDVVFTDGKISVQRIEGYFKELDNKYDPN